MYHVTIDEFEGPLDLLLFFIKRDELDIYNIPIARITNEYLRYVRIIERIDLDGAGDFVYMASELMNIKARMLLPSHGADGEEEEDPRRQLVERLLEYMRHKEAAQELSSQYEERRKVHTRGGAVVEQEEYELSQDEINYQVSVFDLVSVLADVLEKRPDPDESTHAVRSIEYTVEEQEDYILEHLEDRDRVSFLEMITDRPRPFIITTFLAVLELAKRREIGVATRVDSLDFFVLAA